MTSAGRTQRLFSCGSLLERLQSERLEARAVVATRDADWLLDRTDDEAVA